MAKNEKTCFVIMRFAAPYKERCERIYKPAIEDAGLVPHLAGGPGVSDITEDIEKGIRASFLCFADISEDNPNVWYELGFAYACGKQVVMVCDKAKRPGQPPFDVSVKKVIPYKSDYDSDEIARNGFQWAIIKDLQAKAAKVVATPVVAVKATAQGNTGSNVPAEWNRHDVRVFREIAQCTMKRHKAIDKLALQKRFPDMIRLISSIRKLEEERLVSAKWDEISHDNDVGVWDVARLARPILSKQSSAFESPFMGAIEGLAQPSTLPSPASRLLKPASTTAYGLTQMGVKFVLKHPSMLD